MSIRCKDPDNLPDKTGVYLFRDFNDTVLYVGKAKSLKKRVRSYFSGANRPLKVLLIMKNFNSLEYILTDTEKEALILESNLIKKYMPKYNIRLKDDKRYPYVKVSNEDYPRVYITRNVVDDGGYYYGPFTDTGSVRKIVKFLKALFKIRECRRMDGPCLNYQIHLCSAPCDGKITKKEYRYIVEKINLFFEGKSNKIIEMLKEMMIEASSNLEYKKAAVIRDQILSIDGILERQKIIFNRELEQDIIACSYDDKLACVVVFSIRDGKVIGKDDFFMSGTEGTLPDKILSAFLKQYYRGPRVIPSEIIVQYEPYDDDLINEWLSENREREVILRTPDQGMEERLVQMAAKNAKVIKNQERDVKNALLDLKDYLKIPKIPRYIEAFDVSNIAGKQAVGSMAVFEEGKPKKSRYRRYKIKIEGPDDYAMMKDVLSRRYTRLLKENQEKPDLILVDGGKGQLNIAVNVLKSLHLTDIPVIGLAKEFEHIFIPQVSSPIILPPNSEALHLLQRIRDEAHRFAVKYHKEIRSKELSHSILDEINGIGKRRKINLLKHFGDVSEIKKASVDEIASVKGINKDLAHNIHKYLQKSNA